MKLLVDLFACQTHSRKRGIGRYTLSLTREMALLRGQHQMTVLADALYPDSLNELRQEFIRLLPSGSFLPYYHEPLKYAPQQNMETYYTIAETLIEQAYRMVAPDVVLTPSLFDSWADGEQGRVALPDKKYSNHRRAVILYDLIPQIFHELYLDSDPYIKRWFQRRMDLLHSFDLVLAISEATRRDAIDLIGLDPERVVNISGASSAHFHRLELSEAEKKRWLRRLGIARPFVLYIGGNDYRKNMDGALRIYAGLPREISSTHQLVLNDVGDQAAFREKARKLGLDDSDLVIFTRRSDEELQALYNLCKLFVFPSRYEGFGLPIVEAMACGAAVIAANNSSLPEVVGRADALFDVADEQAASALLHRALTDESFRLDLAAYGVQRAQEFSWEKSARLAWEALENMKGSRQPVAGETSSTAQGRLRVAFVSPLPPQKSGVAEYSTALLPYLAEHFDLDLFTEPSIQVTDPALRGRFAIHPWTTLVDRRYDYDAVVYQMGNSELHIPMMELIAQVPGVVVSHDFFLSNLPFVKEVRTGERGLFRKEMDYSHGLSGVVDYVKRGVEAARWSWPMNWRLLKNAQELIIHSEHQFELARRFYSHGWMPSPTLIRHIRSCSELASPAERAAFRKELNLPEEAFVFCSFGFLAHTKLNLITLEAFAQLLANGGAPALLIFVGELDKESDYGKQVLELIRRHGLGKSVRITGYVDRGQYEKYLSCADAAVQLRTDSRGETSGAVLDCMAHGLPTILDAHGSLGDYPDDAVVKLAATPAVEELAPAMLRFRKDSAFRAEKAQRARSLILEAHDPVKVAAAYAAVIRRASRTKEQDLFAPLVDSMVALSAPAPLVQSSSRYAAAHLALRCQPRLLLDATGLAVDRQQTDEADAASGLLRRLFSIGDAAVHFEVVRLDKNHFVRASRAAEALFDLPPLSLGTETAISIQPGDVLVLVDALMAPSRPVPEALGQVRQRGGKVVTVVAEYPDRVPNSWAMESDAFVCTSPAAAEAVRACIEGHETELKAPLDIFAFLGRDAGKSAEQELLGWMLNVMLGAQPAAHWMPQTVQLQKASAAAADSSVTELDVHGDILSAVCRDIAIPGSKPFLVMVDKDFPDGISASILAHQYEAPHHYPMVSDLVRPGGQILDLGAHIGTFSLFAAAKGYQVTSVEAAPRNAALLSESIRRNEFDNMEVLPVAISDHAGTVEFLDNGPWGSIAGEGTTDGRRVSVPSVTVDSVVGDLGLDRLDLIKMDIEGSEVAAVRGMPGLLSRADAPAILFESNGHTLRFFGMTSGDLISAISSFGYQCYHLYGGVLYALNAGDLQLECVADCLAVKQLPDGFAQKWRVSGPMPEEQRVKVAITEMTSPNPDVRAYVGRTLQAADASFLREPRIVQALGALKSDPDARVQESVAWWRGRQPT